MGRLVLAWIISFVSECQGGGQQGLESVRRSSDLGSAVYWRRTSSLSSPATPATPPRAAPHLSAPSFPAHDLSLPLRCHASSSLARSFPECLSSLPRKAFERVTVTAKQSEKQGTAGRIPLTEHGRERREHLHGTERDADGWREGGKGRGERGLKRDEGPWRRLLSCSRLRHCCWTHSAFLLHQSPHPYAYLPPFPAFSASSWSPECGTSRAVLNRCTLCIFATPFVTS